jgi:hypothetical protein
MDLQELEMSDIATISQSLNLKSLAAAGGAITRRMLKAVACCRNRPKRAVLLVGTAIVVLASGTYVEAHGSESRSPLANPSKQGPQGLAGQEQPRPPSRNSPDAAGGTAAGSCGSIIAPPSERPAYVCRHGEALVGPTRVYPWAGRDGYPGRDDRKDHDRSSAQSFSFTTPGGEPVCVTALAAPEPWWPWWRPPHRDYGRQEQRTSIELDGSLVIAPKELAHPPVLVEKPLAAAGGSHTLTVNVGRDVREGVGIAVRAGGSLQRHGLVKSEGGALELFDLFAAPSPSAAAGVAGTGGVELSAEGTLVRLDADDDDAGPYPHKR